MRQITFSDVQDTFLDLSNAERAVDVCHPEQGMQIAEMLTNTEQLEAMELDDHDALRIVVMVYGAFTAGVMTAQRLMEEERMTLLLTAVLATATPTTSTAYCLNGTMADGTGVRAGSVAHNGYRLGTRLTISPSPTGARRFVVRDRIGWGTQLDFWVPSCSTAYSWGRRTVNVKRGWQRKLRSRVRKQVTPGANWHHTHTGGNV